MPTLVYRGYYSKLYTQQLIPPEYGADLARHEQMGDLDSEVEGSEENLSWSSVVLQCR